MNDPLFVRPATLADAPRANAILYETLRAYGIARDPGEVALTLRKAAVERVAQIGEALVGFGVLTFKDDGTAWVAKLFVDARYRRAGAGRLLLRTLVDEARASGMRRVGLSTRSVFREAIALYVAEGWTRGPSPRFGRGRDLTFTLDL